jgi:hypothetical protein
MISIERIRFDLLITIYIYIYSKIGFGERKIYITKSGRINCFTWYHLSWISISTWIQKHGINLFWHVKQFIHLFLWLFLPRCFGDGVLRCNSSYLWWPSKNYFLTAYGEKEQWGV